MAPPWILRISYPSPNLVRCKKIPAPRKGRGSIDALPPRYHPSSPRPSSTGMNVGLSWLFEPGLDNGALPSSPRPRSPTRRRRIRARCSRASSQTLRFGASTIYPVLYCVLPLLLLPFDAYFIRMSYISEYITSQIVPSTRFSCPIHNIPLAWARKPVHLIRCIASPANMYMITYTTTRYVTADPGGMQMKDMPRSPRFPIS